MGCGWIAKVDAADRRTLAESFDLVGVGMVLELDPGWSDLAVLCELIPRLDEDRDTFAQ